MQQLCITYQECGHVPSTCTQPSRCPWCSLLREGTQPIPRDLQHACTRSAQCRLWQRPHKSWQNMVQGASLSSRDVCAAPPGPLPPPRSRSIDRTWAGAGKSSCGCVRRGATRRGPPEPSIRGTSAARENASRLVAIAQRPPTTTLRTAESAIFTRSLFEDNIRLLSQSASLPPIRLVARPVIDHTI